MNGSEDDDVSIGQMKRGREHAEDDTGSISGEDTPQIMSTSRRTQPDLTENKTARVQTPHPMKMQSRGARDWLAEAQRCRSAEDNGLVRFVTGLVVARQADGHHDGGRIARATSCAVFA